MTEIIIAGTLFWQDHSYLLVDPHPIIEREHWLRDLDERFLVCHENGRVFTVTASRPFLISDLRRGEKIQIKAQAEQEAEILKATQEAFDMFKFDEWLKSTPAESAK